MFFSDYERPSFTPIQNRHILMFKLLERRWEDEGFLTESIPQI
jgi:hypothetical protein